MISVDAVPWDYAELLDESDEAYVVTYKEANPIGKLVDDMFSKTFTAKVTVCKDISLRGYWIFVKH